MLTDRIERPLRESLMWRMLHSTTTPSRSLLWYNVVFVLVQLLYLLFVPLASVVVPAVCMPFVSFSRPPTPPPPPIQIRVHIMWSALSAEYMDQPDMIANPARGQLNGESKIFPVPVRA